MPQEVRNEQLTKHLSKCLYHQKLIYPLDDIAAWSTMSPATVLRARHPESPKRGESSLAPCCTQSPRQVAVEDLWPPDPGGWRARLGEKNWESYGIHAWNVMKCIEMSWHVIEVRKQNCDDPNHNHSQSYSQSVNSDNIENYGNPLQALKWISPLRVFLALENAVQSW